VIAALVAATAIALGAATPADTAGESFLRGAEAYFAYVNANGGVRGRPVEVVLDADPAAVVASFGPGGDLPGAAPPPRAEGEAYGRYLAATRPDAKVAVVYAADALGRALLAGLRRAAARQLVLAQPLDPALPDAAAALAAAQAAGADVLCLLAPAASADLYGALAQLRWKPQVVAALSSAYPPAGAVSAAYLKDTGADDPGAALYRRILSTYARGAAPRDPSLLAGMAAAFTAVDVLRHAGAAPSRALVARAAAALNEANNPFLLAGVKVRPGARTAQLALARWLAGRWQPFGGLITARA
jgi:branched-chain amino acid transport system substrate-binding protein